jgi:hypothetical protein
MKHTFGKQIMICKKEIELKIGLKLNSVSF